ncbi:DMT family transporter [Marivibrio halodurans]|uniref:DMT family transporter n=1 Tax=Marivibrio halodurans TaxID=2039722 RepID=A0A8J7V2N9_9PROT|nr:DMT family transporter [Marivibrio halodurans]
MTGDALSRRAALIVALIGLAAVSHAVIFIRLAEAAPALVIAFARVGLATAVFAPFGLMAARRLSRDRSPGRGSVGRAMAISVLAGGFLALHFASWIASLERITIAESTVLVSLTPLWVALFDVVSGRGVPGRALIAAIALCLLGTAVLAFGGVSRVDGDPLGLVLAGAGGVCMAAYLVAGRGARAVLPTSAYVTLCYGAAAVLLALGVAASGAPVVGFDARTVIALLALGLVSQVIGHTSYNWTLSTLPPVLVAILLLGEPVFGSLLGWLYLGETVPPGAAVGGAAILAGLWLAIRAEMRLAASGE